MSRATGDFWQEQRTHVPFQQVHHVPVQQRPPQHLHHGLQMEPYSGPIADPYRPINHQQTPPSRPAYFSQHHTDHFADHNGPRFLDQGRVTVVPVNSPRTDFQHHQYPNARHPLTTISEVGAKIYSSHVNSDGSVDNRAAQLEPIDICIPQGKDITFKSSNVVSTTTSVCTSCDGTGRSASVRATEQKGACVTKGAEQKLRERIEIAKVVTAFVMICGVMVAACFGVYYLWKYIGV